ncbi:alpha-N-arabinofuranosidase [Arachidicoccus rhizosphaerae]|uniref:Alpha-N-arabinofuranosidase n=1 Tax=Arachidicoccus rhizosphaerae TaxID=551991 RepID=A0A1H3XPU7_9BACT|nr:glycoside hydrolase family 43 protein [Arachidicoccus rhizosphaerae]SEA00614.1 alpha-N-arabinofuranosidase [Arachidicoccus rhizosphaerae]
MNKFKALSKIMLGILVLSTTQATVQAQQPVPITLRNPVLKGFYPDPSIIRVDKAGGSDYYLINSTFSYFPGIPVFHSTDMMSWTQIGNVITRPDQMNFMGARMTRGLFAPSISYYKGLFYVICTQVDTGGNFVVTATDPAGPWSNPVFLPEVQGIDPSIFFDEQKDSAYIVYNGGPDGKTIYNGQRALRLYDFDYTHLKVIGTSRMLVNGGVDISTEPQWIEGPHLLKRNDWYYLYAAEGGTAIHHSEVVFRSKNIKGPFLPYEHNPILTQRDLPENREHPITSTGHAQLVIGPDGKTYAFFLGVRPYEADYYNTGRETFLAPVTWVNDWPVVTSPHERIKYSYEARFPDKGHPSGIPVNGNFTYTDYFKGPLDKSYVFLRSADSSSFKTEAIGGQGLLLNVQPATILEYGNPAFIGRRQQHLYGSFTVNLIFDTKKSNEKAGVCVFQDETHFYYACKSYSAKNGVSVIQLYQADSTGKGMELLAEKSLPARNPKQNEEAVEIKINMEGTTYSFLYRSDERKKWESLKDNLDARPLSTHAAGGFIGCMLGLYATSQGVPSSGKALYNWTRYQGADKTDRL